MNKRTEQEWLTLFHTHRNSGLSAAAFCKEHKLCPKYFSKRRRQLEGEAIPSGGVKSPFVKALSPSFSSSAVTGESQLLLRGHFGELRLPKTVSPHWLASLLKSLA